MPTPAYLVSVPQKMFRNCGADIALRTPPERQLGEVLVSSCVWQAGGQISNFVASQENSDFFRVSQSHRCLLNVPTRNINLGACLRSCPQKVWGFTAEFTKLILQLKETPPLSPLSCLSWISERSDSLNHPRTEPCQFC